MTAVPEPRPVAPVPVPPRPSRAHSWMYRALWTLAAVLMVWLVWRNLPAVSASPSAELPTARVARGDVTITIQARGELRGGSSQMLTVPMVSDNDAGLALTFLRRAGELVQPGEVVAQFDTTEQTYKLKQAQADLAEAEQQVIKAQADAQAQQETDRYALIKARDDVKIAELDVRKNPILSAIDARKNDLALQAARDHLKQVEQDIANRQQTTAAAIAIQRTARQKAEVQAKTAQRNITEMALRASKRGYIAIQPNTNTNFFFDGMTFPTIQVGDLLRPGEGVVEIPDTSSWQVTAHIGELDRGHVSIGETAQVTVSGLPGRSFRGHIKNTGGLTGPPWNRHFDCDIALDEGSPQLRPGLNASVNITTEKLKDVPWVPAQAVFDRDGKSFVYVASGSTFTPKDIKIVRRSESQVVVSGLEVGQKIALASPEQQRQASKSFSVLKALGR